jgi:hypothetical protein
MQWGRRDLQVSFLSFDLVCSPAGLTAAYIEKAFGTAVKTAQRHTAKTRTERGTQELLPRILNALSPF